MGDPGDLADSSFPAADRTQTGRDRGSRALVVGLCAAVALVLLGAGVTTAGLGARSKARSDLDAERRLVQAQRSDVASA